MIWKKAKHFTEDFIVKGDWNLEVIGRFPKAEFLAADTETMLYLNNVHISDEEVYQLYREKGQSWIKENLEVRAYAFTLSDGESFALFQNAEDFLTACAMFGVKRVFWYNAKFDFAIFDYYFLTHGWKESEEKIETLDRYQRLDDKTYQSLNGDFGQRYQMRIWKSYINRRYQEKVHNFKFVDICNIYGGGLAKNLEDWKIKDRHGNDIRKLTMEYDNPDIETDLPYMINDTKGLYLLAEVINETLLKISGFSLFNGDYITAGGLAKRSLLEFMFKQHSKSKNVKMFKKAFPISANEDIDYRTHYLYCGGKCLVNPYKKGQIQRTIYKYDVNSMYPKQMRDMLYPYGLPKFLEDEDEIDNKCVHIYYIKNFCGRVKPNKIGVWQDKLTGDYVENFFEFEPRYIWKDEIEELKNWYYLSYELIDILEFDARKPKGAISYIDTFYDIKSHSKGAVKNGAKLFLNSAYGKLAQRIERVDCHYELSQEGYVRLVKGETKIDESSMLSVVVGSRVTALARVMLMQYIRAICGENVKDNFIYCDTDSVHSLCRYDDTDERELGKMKEEGVYNYGIYLAPKTYLMYDNLIGSRSEYEVHCKGVNTNVVMDEIVKCNNFEEAVEVFAPNRLFKCLCGLNVKGGKALLYVDKMILNEKNYKQYKAIDQGLDEVGE